MAGTSNKHDSLNAGITNNPANTRHGAKIDLWLSQRRRRWLNINSSLVQLRFLAGKRNKY